MKVRNILLGAFLVGAMVSCSDDFLTYTPSDALPSDGAYKTAKDVSNGLNGAYYTLGYYRFYGRNVVALGDIAADNCYMTGASGHFNEIYRYQIVEQLTDLQYIWQFGYQLLDRTTRVINGGVELVAAGGISDADKNSINSYISQAYALRALGSFALANIFCMPYNSSNASGLGIVLVNDNPISIDDKISRSSLGETYEQILSDIVSAKEYAGKTTSKVDQYYFNAAAISALEARVKLFMGDYPGAITAAETAIAARNGAIEYDADKYYAQWATTAINGEDIFTISKSTDDNLSANSLNTLYGSYGGLVTPQLAALFAENDIRKSLLNGTGNNIRGLKFMGLSTSAATSNIPVLRLPEMYLILAECYAQTSADLTLAKQNLFVIAKKNKDITSEDELPGTKENLLKFIAEERQRELFQEGHRWYDLRRTGEIMNRTTGIFTITNYDVSKFRYPIPKNEINASGIEQNAGWADNLPN